MRRLKVGQQHLDVEGMQLACDVPGAHELLELDLLYLVGTASKPSSSAIRSLVLFGSRPWRPTKHCLSRSLLHSTSKSSVCLISLDTQWSKSVTSWMRRLCRSNSTCVCGTWAAHGIPVEKLKDERGISHEGILIPSGARKWKVFATYATDYSEQVHHEHQQVRAGQGADLKAWYRGDLAKISPLGVKGGRCISLQDLQEVATKVAEHRKIEEEKAKLFATDESAEAKPAEDAQPDVTGAGQEQAKEDNADEDSVDYDLAELDPLLQGPSGASTKRKAKAKAKEKAAGRLAQSTAGKRNSKSKKADSVVTCPSRRITGKTAAGTRSVASVTDLEGGSVIAGGSSRSSSKKELSPLEAAQQTYHSNVKSLDIEKTLRGEKMGNERFQVERAISSLGKSKEGAVQKILLQSHLNMWYDACKLLPSNIHRVPNTERVRILENLATNGVSIPPHTRGGLLAAALDDYQTLEEKAVLLHPPCRSDTEPFDPMAPKLATCGVSSSEVGRLLQRCLVSEGYVPLLCKGAKTRDDILATSRYLVEQWEGLLQSDVAEGKKMEAMVECAVREVVHVARAMIAILSERSPPSAASLGTSQDVARLVDAKEGLLLIIKKASLACSICTSDKTG